MKKKKELNKLTGTKHVQEMVNPLSAQNSAAHLHHAALGGASAAAAAAVGVAQSIAVAQALQTSAAMHQQKQIPATSVVASPTQRGAAISPLSSKGPVVGGNPTPRHTAAGMKQFSSSGQVKKLVGKIDASAKAPPLPPAQQATVPEDAW